MAYTGLDDLLVGMASGSYRLPIGKATLASQVVGSEASLWRATGVYPPQGSVPTTAAVCNASTTGSIALAARSTGEERIISHWSMMTPVVGNLIILEDRLAHMGGLSGTVTTAQTVNVDVSGSTDNLPERIGATGYSEVEWYLEWYTATGATISTPTASVTYHDNTNDTCNIWVLGATALPASVGASRRYKIVPNSGKWIKSIQSVTLSASTGTAGNFGVTAVRRITEFESTQINLVQVRDWSFLNAPLVYDNACLTLAQSCANTSTGAISGAIRQAVK